MSGGVASIFTPVTKADDIPGFCAGLAKEAARQPRFDGSVQLYDNCKVLPVEDWSTVLLCERISQASSNIFGEETMWHVRQIGPLTDAYDSLGKLVKRGICLVYFNGFTPCSEDVLEDSYRQVIKQMQAGWKTAMPEDHPNIMYKEDSEKFNLLVKKAPLLLEAEVLHLVAIKCGLADYIKISRLRTTDLYHGDGTIYTWVKKTEYTRFLELMGFKL